MWELSWDENNPFIQAQLRTGDVSGEVMWTKETLELRF
jgi:hypothetical protein